ncbi:hypothetical protein FB451DRAFT_1195811 [Mycena latifolia]|nr:hypothetical protein FB451DRAFT_1195811 [Mycena latifolia]
MLGECEKFSQGREGFVISYSWKRYSTSIIDELVKSVLLFIDELFDQPHFKLLTLVALAPLELVRPHILRYWKMRKTDKEILQLLRTKHIDYTKYGIGLTRLREMWVAMGLLRTRQQDHNVESIRDAMLRVRAQYPNAGQREISGLLFHEENMSVPRAFGRLGSTIFWAVDQHDKWKYKFGLALHSGRDLFVGRIQWLKIWWTNSNPRLILSYYLDTVEQSGFMPLVSQSDPGGENFGLANGHTLLRHWHDPSLVGTLQHHWMNEKKNVMPEIGWSQLRRRYSAARRVHELSHFNWLVASPLLIPPPTSSQSALGPLATTLSLFCDILPHPPWSRPGISAANGGRSSQFIGVSCSAQRCLMVVDGPHSTFVCSIGCEIYFLQVSVLSISCWREVEPPAVGLLELPQMANELTGYRVGLQRGIFTSPGTYTEVPKDNILYQMASCWSELIHFEQKAEMLKRRVNRSTAKLSTTAEELEGQNRYTSPYLLPHNTDSFLSEVSPNHQLRKVFGLQAFNVQTLYVAHQTPNFRIAGTPSARCVYSNERSGLVPESPKPLDGEYTS